MVEGRNSLEDYLVDQAYHTYTTTDHRVWGHVVGKNYRYYRTRAHPSFSSGFKRMGLDLARIPNIAFLNSVLKQFGWQAACVDGYVPPRIYARFVASRRLIVARNIRSEGDAEHSPYPDIIHEVSGHFPMLVNEELTRFVQEISDVMCKAFMTPLDFELYLEKRNLGSLNADPSSDPRGVRDAEAKVSDLKLRVVQSPSEFTHLSRMRLWSVEFGLIGSASEFKIFGAGLLSSRLEGESAFGRAVPKIPYGSDVIHYEFDVSDMQSQLFVTPDFEHLRDVLYSYADTMAFKRGGRIGVDRAILSKEKAVIGLDSGVDILGYPTSYLEGEDGNAAAIVFSGPVRITGEPGNCDLSSTRGDVHVNVVSFLPESYSSQRCFTPGQTSTHNWEIGPGVTIESESNSAFKVDGPIRLLSKMKVHARGKRGISCEKGVLANGTITSVKPSVE